MFTQTPTISMALAILEIIIKVVIIGIVILTIQYAITQQLFKRYKTYNENKYLINYAIAIQIFCIYEYRQIREIFTCDSPDCGIFVVIVLLLLSIYIIAIFVSLPIAIKLYDFVSRKIADFKNKKQES